LRPDAFGIEEFQISGGAAWINSDRFDIIGKARRRLLMVILCIL
jgi:hypothetical protein